MSQPDWNDEELAGQLDEAGFLPSPSRYFVGNEYIDRTQYAAEHDAWLKSHDELLDMIHDKPAWIPQRLWVRLPKSRRVIERERTLNDAYQAAYAAEWYRASHRMDMAERKPPFPGPSQ